MEERYQASRDAMQTDEFMKPLIINEEGLVKGVGVWVCAGLGLSRLQLWTLFFHSDNDTVIFIDFRADRMRQIVEAVGIKPQFDTDTIPQNLVGIEMRVANTAPRHKFLEESLCKYNQYLDSNRVYLNSWVFYFCFTDKSCQVIFMVLIFKYFQSHVCSVLVRIKYSIHVHVCPLS